MPFDASGNFSRVMNWQTDRDNGIRILADRHDEEDDNFANGFNVTFLRTGTVPMSGDLSMGGNEINTLKAGAEGNPSLTWELDPFSGFYQPAPKQIGLTINGSRKMLWGEGNVQSDVLFKAPDIEVANDLTIGGDINVNGSLVAKELVSPGNGSEGGQIVLGYKNNTDLNSAENGTWITDVDTANDYRIYRYGDDGSVVFSLVLDELTGDAVFHHTLTVNNNLDVGSNIATNASMLSDRYLFKSDGNAGLNFNTGNPTFFATNMDWISFNAPQNYWSHCIDATEKLQVRAGTVEVVNAAFIVNNTYTKLVANSPLINFNNTSQGTDRRQWEIYNAGGLFYIRTVNDAYTASNAAITLERGGDGYAGWQHNATIFGVAGAQRVSIRNSGLTVHPHDGYSTLRLESSHHQFIWQSVPAADNGGGVRLWNESLSGELIRFHPSFNVGIGHVNPGFKLHVNGHTGVDGAVYSRGSSAGFQMWSRNSGGNEWLLYSRDNWFVIHQTGVADMVWFSQSAMMPRGYHSYSLGDGNYPYWAIHSANWITVSDEREKKWRGDLYPNELKAAREIIAEIGMYRLLREIGTDRDKLQCGVRAQRVQAIMEKNGINALDYGFFHHMEWDDRIDHDIDGNDIVVPAGERYALDYSKLSMFLIAAQEQRLNTMEDRLAYLEGYGERSA